MTTSNGTIRRVSNGTASGIALMIIVGIYVAITTLGFFALTGAVAYLAARDRMRTVRTFFAGLLPRLHGAA